MHPRLPSATQESESQSGFHQQSTSRYAVGTAAKGLTKSFPLLHEGLTLGYFMIKTSSGGKGSRVKSMVLLLPRSRSPTNLVPEALPSVPTGPAHQTSKCQPPTREPAFVKC